MVFAGALFADEYDEVVPVHLDVSVFNVTKKQTRTAVLKALNLKRWVILSMEDNVIKMSYNGINNMAKVDLSQFPKITIVNTEDSEELSVRYFEVLRRVILSDLVTCAK